MMKKKFVFSQNKSFISNPSFIQQNQNSGVFTDEIENLPYKFKDSLSTNPSFAKPAGPFDEPKYDSLEEAAKKGIQQNPLDVDFVGFEQKARNAYQEKLQKHKQEADALLNKSSYKDLTKTILTKDMFDNNLAAVKVELDRIKKLIPTTQKQIKDYNNRLILVAEYKTTLEQQAVVLESKQKYESLEASSAVAGSAAGPLGIKPSENMDWQGRADLESLQRLIRQRQENIADIESYIFGLVTGVEQFAPYKTDVAHTNAKFIKIAEDDMLKQADEEIENYYNELYEDSEGSPDFGTALEHPKETRNELTTKIHQHRFKKK
jgi:hypothetical protein